MMQQVEYETHSGYDEIARRAYFLFEARGREDGEDLQDWLTAERELMAEVQTEAPAEEPAESAAA